MIKFSLLFVYNNLMIYVVMGPTASGKTSAANSLMDLLNCPAINFDAFQIYQKMDIGTSKLEKSDPHYSHYHLLDFVSPKVSYSVKDYQDVCRKELDKLLKENKDIVMVGGTGLYLRATLFDYSFNEEDEIDTSYLEEFTNEELHERLEKLDYEESKKIHTNNRKRLIRAISMIENSGQSKTELLSKQKHELIYKDVKFLYLCPPREELYKKIDERVDQMVEQGLFEEVKTLYENDELSLTAKQGIGYKEVIDYLEGRIDCNSCVSLIKQRTRNYAKRQVTFFSHQFESIRFESKEQLINYVKEQ